MESKGGEADKQNGSPSVDPTILQFEKNADNSEKIEALVHQDGQESGDHVTIEYAADNVLSTPEQKPKHKMIHSAMQNDTEDAITPLSDDNSPTVDQGWVEYQSEDPNKQTLCGRIFCCCGVFSDAKPITFSSSLCILMFFAFHAGNLATDIAVCYFLYHHGNMWWFWLVVIFTAVPILILNIISYHLTVYKILIKRALYSESPPIIVTIMVTLLHLMQCGVFFRYMGYIFRLELEIMWSCFCSTKFIAKLKHRAGWNIELYYIPYMFLVEAILQCFPQLVLQLYILVKGQNELDSTTQNAIIASLVLSLLDVSFLITVCKHLFKNCQISWIGLGLIFLWYFFTTISRVLTFALFATKFLLGFLLLCLCHWIIMSVWSVQLQTSLFECQEWSRCRQNIKKYLKSLLYGVIYLLCFLTVHIREDNDEHNLPTRYFYAFFYAVIFLENTVLSVLWYIYSDPNVWYYVPAVIVIFLSFFIGLAFMIIYYRFFHPNIINHVRRWMFAILFPEKRRYM